MIPYADVGQSKGTGGETDEDYDIKAKEVTWYHRVILNRPLKVVLLGLILAVATPMLIYHYLFFSSLDIPPSDGYSVGSCLLQRSLRLPCGVGTVKQTECNSQCCYDLESNLCFHRFPSRFTYILEEEWLENVTLTPRIRNVPFNSQEATKIKLSIDEISSTHMSITFYDPKNTTLEGRRITEKDYSYHIASPELTVIVNDKSGNNMFNTARGPIIAAENIWEISFRLTDEVIYGLGEIPLVEGTVKVLYNHNEDFNGIPLIFSRTNGTYHGILIDVLEPTEVRVLRDNQIVVRSITTRGLKFHLFSGPQPKDVMNDIMNVIQFRNELEYWMLGAHICSESSPSSGSYDELNDFLTNATAAQIPFDSHCGVSPIAFHDERCEEDNDDVNKGAVLIRSVKKRFVPHVSAHIHYKEPNTTSEDNSTDTVETRLDKTKSNCTSIVNDFQDAILRTPDKESIYKGKVGDELVVYPDYETGKDIVKELWGELKADAIILENSWPLDESLKQNNETYEILPYFSKNFERAFNNTPQWDITRPNGEIYMYTHNQYGNHFANAFRLITEESIPIWASSQWFNGDIVNRQNISTSWASLHKELTEAALGGVSGHWLWTSPICGDTERYNGQTQAHLCVKWYMAATYFPFIAIHSKVVPRHPLAFSGNNNAYIKTALNNRQSLLPYFYTTLKEGPLLRPMFYQFPDTVSLSDLNTQFSVGEDLIIVPNLLPSQSHVHFYMPPGQWYELWSGLPLEAEEGEPVTMTTTDADFFVVIRGDAIVVMQKDVKETAEETRLQSDYSLTIALNCENVNNKAIKQDKITICHAKGKLYMTEELTLIFEADHTNLTIKATGKDFSTFCNLEQAVWARKVKEMNVFGLDEELNNNDGHRHVTADIDLCRLEDQEEIVFDFSQ